MNGIGLGDILKNLEEIDWPFILLVLVGAWLLNFAFQRFLPWLARQLPSRFRHYILPLVPILRLVITVGAMGSILPQVIDMSSPQNIFTVLGAAGLAVGFAFKDYITSIIAGVVALYERPYRVGDWVQIGGDYGEVRHMGMRALKIVTPDDTVVTIPHAKIWESNIANANDGNREHMVVADFYLHPAHNAERVRQTLWDVGVTSPYTHLGHPVTVIVREQPWGTHYRLKAYPIDGRDEFLFLSDLTVRGKAALAALNVEPVMAPMALSYNRPGRNAWPAPNDF